MKKFHKRGQSLVEYALILGMIVLVIAVSLKLLGTNISDMFTTLNNYLSTIS